MKLRKRNNLLIEPPSAATGDIAFNLIVFFLVCASVQPDSGRRQNIPASETTQEKEEKTENIEIALSVTRDAKTGVPVNRALINGESVAEAALVPTLAAKLAGKTSPEDRMVVVKSANDTPYQFWIAVTTGIEEAGGIVTLQLEEERTVQAE